VGTLTYQEDAGQGGGERDTRFGDADGNQGEGAKARGLTGNADVLAATGSKKVKKVNPNKKRGRLNSASVQWQDCNDKSLSKTLGRLGRKCTDQRLRSNETRGARGGEAFERFAGVQGQALAIGVKEGFRRNKWERGKLFHKSELTAKLLVIKKKGRG